MKGKLFLSTATALLFNYSAQANAKSVEDLKLHCEGTYKVVESVPFYRPSQGRALDQAGTHEKIKVLNIGGVDCDTLETHYGLSVKKDQVLKFSTATAPSWEKANAAAQARQGNSFPFQVSQSFHYKTKANTLPLFPLVHQEWAHLLGMTGKADSHTLYGTPNTDSLSDQEKLNALRKAFGIMGWGKVFQNSTWGYSDWLALIGKLEPKSKESTLEYGNQLVTFFKNIVRHKTSFVSSSPGVLVGRKINSLLNKYGEIKFQTKLKALKRNPLLFEDQIVGWAIVYGENTAPQLDGEAMESFLEHAKEQSENLAKVPQVLEARYLLGQYKAAAKTIKAHSGAQTGKKAYYNLSKAAEALIEEILSIR